MLAKGGGRWAVFVVDTVAWILSVLRHDCGMVPFCHTSPDVICEIGSVKQQNFAVQR